MTKTRDLRALLAVLVAMLLALIAGVVLVRLAGAEVPEHHPPIYVSGKDQGVTATGIYLNDGDRVDFSANGKFGPGCVFCSGEISPNGDPNTTTDATFLAPGKPAYSLLGKVPGSDYFEIGSNETWTYGGGVPAQLFLAINDRVNQYGDNTGGFNVTIDVYRAVKTPTPTTTSKPTPTPTNTDPTIDSMKPASGSKIRNLAPLISATVQDAETDLSASNIKLFVDESPRTASYDQASNKLTYKSANLARGRHTVRIEATDEKGQQTIKDWSFSIVKKKHK